MQEGSISSGISYADLGATLVEAASRRDKLRSQEVAVLATGKVRVQHLTLVRYLLTRLRSRLLPFDVISLSADGPNLTPYPAI